MYKSQIFDGKISQNFVFRLKVDKFLITKMNFINRKNYLKYKIFASEVFQKIEFLFKKKIHIFYNVLGLIQPKRCLQSSFNIFFRLDI